MKTSRPCPVGHTRGRAAHSPVCLAGSFVEGPIAEVVDVAIDGATTHPERGRDVKDLREYRHRGLLGSCLRPCTTNVFQAIPGCSRDLQVFAQVHSARYLHNYCDASGLPLSSASKRRPEKNIAILRSNCAGASTGSSEVIDTRTRCRVERPNACRAWRPNTLGGESTARRLTPGTLGVTRSRHGLARLTWRSDSASNSSVSGMAFNESRAQKTAVEDLLSMTRRSPARAEGSSFVANVTGGGRGIGRPDERVPPPVRPEL